MKPNFLNGEQKKDFITSINLVEDNIVVAYADDVVKYIPKNAANYYTMTKKMEAQIYLDYDINIEFYKFGLGQYHFLPILASTILFYGISKIGYEQESFKIWATLFTLYYTAHIPKIVNAITTDRDLEKFMYYSEHECKINSKLKRINAENIDMQMPMSEELIYKCEKLQEKILNLDVALVDKTSLKEVKDLLLYLDSLPKENLEEDNKFLIRKDSV